MSTLRYWVWLSTMTELRPKVRCALLDVFGDPEAVYFADEAQLLERCKLTPFEREQVLKKDLTRADAILEQCTRDKLSILTLADAAYPQRLKNIFDPPVVLYIRGRLPALDEEAAIAVVGTRRATPYGLKMARRMGFELTKGGGLVVTGLAGGVDSASAEGALRAGGRCVGVLGCAIDEVYPQWNTALYDDVAAVGALVSEYPPGDEIQRKNFPERNRIMSGLSLGVTVIEAPEGSGALITAAHALEQGREVFAVPGNADQLNCVGSNALIRSGAILAATGWDVLSEFAAQFPQRLEKPDGARLREFYSEERESVGSAPTPPVPEHPVPKPLPPEKGHGFAKLRVRNDRKRIDNTEKREYIDLQQQLSGLSENQLKIVSAMDAPSMHVDDIIEKTGIPAAAVLSELTLLQIKGCVVQEPGKRFTLNIRKR